MRSRCRIDAEEFRWRDANHGERHVVDEQRLPDGIGGVAEPALAVASAHDRDRCGAREVVVAMNQATRGRHHRQAAEEVTGYVFPGDEGGLAP